MTKIWNEGFLSLLDGISYMVVLVNMVSVTVYFALMAFNVTVYLHVASYLYLGRSIYEDAKSS